MRVSWQGLWRGCKLLLTPVVLACVVWQFARILLADELWQANVPFRHTAFVAVTTMIGFLIVVLPGGLGVRELLLQQFLTRSLIAVVSAKQAAVTSVAAVLLLRLVWITVELGATGLFIGFLLPDSSLRDHLPRERMNQSGASRLFRLDRATFLRNNIGTDQSVPV
jgi:uncharacterized membrane protein YbhN (UPF0104 family)